MKLLVAAGLYPPEIGGPATYARMLETELPTHGIEVAVLPFSLVRTYPRGIKHALYAWKLFRAAKGVDVIYALDPHSVGWPALLVSRLRRAPLLVRLGGDYAWESGRVRWGLQQTLDAYTAAPKNAPLPVRFLAWMQTFMVRRARRVIVPSGYLQHIVASWGVDQRRIAVIYSALYPLPVHEDRQTIRQRLSFPYPTVVSAGRLVPWKGFRALIEAVATLRSEFQELQLVIIGDGPERESLTKRVAALGLQQHVRFTGQLPKAELGAHIKAADVFVLNTAYEGLSHQLLEVMQLGTPIVTTDVGGNPELLSDRNEGIVVPYNDIDALAEGVRRVLHNPEIAGGMVQRARLKTAGFQTETVVAQLAAELNRIASHA